MDAIRFDQLARVLSHASSRRQTLLAVLLGGVLTTPVFDDAAAGPGCKNVGKKCKKAKDCCSGICKGKKDKKKCKAHDTGGCQASEAALCEGADVACTTSAGEEGECLTTTGNAGYCFGSALCFSCTRDADCREVCGPQAACTLCSDACEDEGGTACAGPAIESCALV